MLGTTAYLVILGVSISALFGVHWMAMLAGATALASISLVEHRHYRSRFAAVGMSDVFRSFALSNVGVSLVAASAAYLLGSGVRLVAFG